MLSDAWFKDAHERLVKKIEDYEKRAAAEALQESTQHSNAVRFVDSFVDGSKALNMKRYIKQTLTSL